MQRKHGWYIAAVFVAIVGVLGGLWLISVPPGGFWDWTGLDGKTAWDLADLLIVPLALAGVVFRFNRWQKQFELEQAQRERENERQIASDHEGEAILQNYFDRMAALLLEHNLRSKMLDYKMLVYEDSENIAIPEAFIIAQARTTATLRRLSDVQRRNAVLRFLLNTDLPLLREVDLREMEMIGMDLQGVDFEKANLEKANLTGANLQGAMLQGANLEKANLTGANLEKVDLRGARLQGANLEKVNLEGANLEGANLEGANLQGAMLQKIFWWSGLEDVNLWGAKYNDKTQWPSDFNPKDHDMILVATGENHQHPSDINLLNRLLDE